MTQIKPLKKAVHILLDGYKNKVEGFGLEEFLKTGVDPFRFTVNVSIWGVEKAIRKEIEHKVEMALENLVGTFHENYLGNCIHEPTNSKWHIIPAGEIPGIDIANYDKKTYLQIKSKHNSMNSSSSARLAQQLEELSLKDPDATVGCAWVIATSRRKAIGETTISKVGKCIKGKAVYETVTGTANEMDSVLEKLPELIKGKAEQINFGSLLDKAAMKVAADLQALAKKRGITAIQVVAEKSVD